VIGRAVRVRIAATAGLLAAVFAVLIGRAAQLTLIEGPELRRLAVRQHRARVPLPPKRGLIVDRFGEPLAMTRESAAVYVRPTELRAGPETLNAVAHLLGLPPKVVTAKASAAAPFVWLDRNVPLDRWALVEELGIAGIGSESARQRVYPYGPVAGQVLGFVSIDGQGLEGVERKFDADLRGEAVALDVERDARGRRMVLDGEVRPLPRVGARVELTLDAELQRVAEDELARAVREFGAEAGTLILLDPHTGEVLVMATVPRFDPNAFAAATPQHWRNRAITDAYEPGSTFKAILAAAALDAGVVAPTELVDCERGRYPVGRRVIHDHHPQGTLTFTQVIVKSSNIGSAKVAERLGRERLGAAIARFGFGRPTGIDLPGEVAGLVRPVERWGRIHLVTNAFGQGISVTPLQLVRAFAAIANGGLLMRPYLVRRVVAEDGTERYRGEPHVVGRVIPRAVAATVTEILRGVVESGTGTAARIEGVAVAGKTGTAQKVDPRTRRYSARARVSSFVGYLPAEDPRFVMLVVIDTPTRATYGGVVAAPVFRHVGEYALDRRGVRPWTEPAVPGEPPRPDRLQPVLMGLDEPGIDPQRGIPDFTGLGMREALRTAHNAGLAVRIEGSGYVVAQDPPPGAGPLIADVSLQFGSAVH
jgi:cell division protein FtsI (penicillin-binding protein 3)